MVEITQKQMYLKSLFSFIHIFFYLSTLYSFFHLKVILNRPKEGSQTFLRLRTSYSLCRKLWMCLFSMMFWGLKFLSG